MKCYFANDKVGEQQKIEFVSKTFRIFFHSNLNARRGQVSVNEAQNIYDESHFGIEVQIMRCIEIKKPSLPHDVVIHVQLNKILFEFELVTILMS